ncbi:MAG: hypothetical protein WBD53_14410 [Xanthobacteraceae bacterium]
MSGFRQIKSPSALATLGAFLVPEPLGACLVLLAIIWWLCRKLYSGNNPELLPEISDRNLSFYVFRADHGAAATMMIPVGTSPIIRGTPRFLGSSGIRGASAFGATPTLFIRHGDSACSDFELQRLNFY